MALRLPDGFTRIKDAHSIGQISQYIGVLISKKAPIKTGSGDWSVELSIQDDFKSGTVGGPSSITCKFLKKQMADLPTVGAIGDLVMIRNIELEERPVGGARVPALFSGNRLSTEVLVFPSGRIPQPENSTAYAQGGTARLSYTGYTDGAEPSAEERLAIINLNAASRPLANKIQAYSATRKQSKGFVGKRRLIRDLEFNKYADIFCEVVKFWNDQRHPGTLDVYVTDYTPNDNLRLYENPDAAEFPEYCVQNWEGPYGKMTFQLRMWEPHASFVREKVKKDDLILLQNVHVKLSSDSNNMEGALHQDPRFPDKVCVVKLLDRNQIKELQERKEAYLFKNAHKVVDRIYNQETENKTAKKSSAKQSERKKEQKREKQRQKQQEQQALEKKIEEKSAAQGGINPHIRASHGDVQLSTVEEIMSNPARKGMSATKGAFALPFVNAKYRTRLRVVDFAPRDIHKFAHSMADPDYNSSLRDLNLYERRRDDRWEWQFMLLAEAADDPSDTSPHRFPLLVAGKDADFLLKLGATDLRNPRSNTIHRLKELLFILWGNLLEAKDELEPRGVKFPLPSGDTRLQNKSFECCIQEYGVKVPKSEMFPYGYRRTYRINNTTIMN